MTPPHKICIAIAGGGIAGATLFYALRQQIPLDFHNFEAAPKIREGGASVGIHYNAYKVLEHISPGAVACLDAAGAFELDGFTASMAVGDDLGRTGAVAGEEGNMCGACCEEWFSSRDAEDAAGRCSSPEYAHVQTTSPIRDEV